MKPLAQLRSTRVTMLSTLFLIYFVRCVYCEIIPRCSDAHSTGMTFTPVEGYVGRYAAELCAQAGSAGLRREWQLQVSVLHSRDFCNASHPVRRRLVSGRDHSATEDSISTHYNCTDNQTVCISTQFDLIFSACYLIRSKFRGESAPPDHFYFNITNKYTEKHIHNNQAIVDFSVTINTTSVVWHPGIPLSNYKVEICNQTDLNSCEPASGCTGTDAITIKCSMEARVGCFRMYLWHDAAWRAGLFYKQASVPYDFCRSAGAAVEVRGALGAWAGALGGAAAALLGAGVAARLLRNRLKHAAKQKEVLRKWLMHRGVEAGAGAGAGAGARHVVVLRAREGPAAARAAAALADAIAPLIEGQVWDLFSAEVLSVCARAPAGWVRETLARADCAVLLLQTPALHDLMLHAAADTPVPGPCAGGEPSFGSALLQYALRLAREDLRRAHHYHKYYVAQVSGLAAEVVPCLAPYRRYELPAAAELLLRDLCGAPPEPRALATLAAALREWRDLHRDPLLPDQAPARC